MSRTQPARTLDQAIILITLDRRNPGRTSQRMPGIGQSGQQHLWSRERGRSAADIDHRAERHMRAGESFRECHDVRPALPLRSAARRTIRRNARSRS